MHTWTDFATAEPDLAATGAALLNQFGVGLAFLATVDGDGAPRLHPVCPVLSRHGLYVLITPTSPKCGDLARDGRYALQTFPQPKPGSDEFYVAGRARPVDDTATRQHPAGREAHGRRLRGGLRAADLTGDAHAVGEPAHAADAAGAAGLAERRDGERPDRLGPDDLAVQDADQLDLGLEAIARLQEVAGSRAHALRRAGGDHVAGQQGHALGEHLDALGHRKDHLRGVARLTQLPVHPE